MKIKEEISDIVASSCRGARGGVHDGSMTSTSTASFPPEASNYTNETAVLSAATSGPLVAGLVGVGCIGGVKRKGKKMKGKKSKGKIKGVQGSSAPSDVQQVREGRIIYLYVGLYSTFVRVLLWLQPRVGALAWVELPVPPSNASPFLRLHRV